MRVGVSTKLFGFLLAALSLLPSAAIAQVQINQTFIPQGPSPAFGPLDTTGSADANDGMDGTNSGAVQAILLDPMLGAGTMFIGSTNGGIWMTTDAGVTWTPLTDNFASLSIASLALNPTDPTGNTLIAGIGVTTSGNWGPALDPGARPTGLILSTDGGQSWTPLPGASAFANQSVIGVAAFGSGDTMTILAATFEEKDPTCAKVDCASYGLYISTDGGQSFNLASGLPAGPVTSLVADPSDPSHLTFYAAVTSPNPTAQDNPIGVYVTTDGGQIWRQVFSASDMINPNDSLVLKVAAGPNQSLAVAAFENPENGKQTVAGLFLSQNALADDPLFSALNVPSDVNTMGDPSGVTHSAVAIDPNSPPGSPIVYLAGWDQGGPGGIWAFSFQGQTVTPLTCDLNASGQCTTGPIIGTAHADARAFVIDAAGNLLLGSDGGVYKLLNPQNNPEGGTPTWTGLNTSMLQVREPFQVGYGANAHRLVVAAQDNGVAIQSAPNSVLYNSVQRADGHVAVVSDMTFADLSVYYTSTQSLDDLARVILDSNGEPVSPPGPTPAGIPVTCNLSPDQAVTGCGMATGGTLREQNVTVELNGVNPTYIALTSGFDVYVAQDNAPASASLVCLEGVPPSPGCINLTLTNLSPSDSGRDKPVRRALAYGTSDLPFLLLAGGENSLFLSPTADPGSSDAAGSLKEVNDYHTLGGQTPTSIVFGVFDESQEQQHFYVADGSSLWAGACSNCSSSSPTVTIELGLLPPENLIFPTSLEFINQNGVDALLVGGLMNCAGSDGICDPSQSPIAFAASDSHGALADFQPFGSGLPNALVYQMSYNPLADVLAVASVGRGVWTLYDVTSYFPQATALQFGLADNDSIPDASYLTDGTTLDGVPFSRPLEKFGTGTTILSGVSTYTGDTSIFGGTLTVNGSIVSSPHVFVNLGATLAGTGKVGSTIINPGGTLSPGNGIGTVGTLNVAGDLLFEPGSLYLTNVVGNTASSTAATDAAMLAGTVLTQFQPGSLTNSYTILSAAGGRFGTFDTFTPIGLPSFVSASLGYTATDVTLDLTSQITKVDGLTRNQHAVGGALDHAFNSGRGIPDKLNAALFALPAGELPPALDALSGEVQATTSSVLVDQSRYERDAILGRMIQAGYGSDSGQVAALGANNSIAVASLKTLDGQAMSLGPGGAYIPPPAPDLAFWTRGFGAWANFDGNGNAASAARQLGGFVSGMDAGVGNGWRIGAATGFSQSDISVDARHSSADVDTVYLAAYAGGNFGPIALRSGGSWGWHDIDSSRFVSFPGFSEKEEVSYHGDTGQVFGEAAYPMLMGSAAVEPFAGLAFVRVSTDPFHERGGEAALRGAGEDEEESYSTLGLRAATTWRLSSLVVTPHASAAWQHAFGDLNPDAALAFLSTGTGFVVAGVPLAQNSALIDAGFDLNLRPSITLGVSYAGQFANDLQDNAVNGRFTWLF